MWHHRFAVLLGVVVLWAAAGAVSEDADLELRSHLSDLLFLGDELGIPRDRLVLPRRQVALALPPAPQPLDPCFNGTNWTNGYGFPCNGTNSTNTTLPPTPIATTTGVAPTNISTIMSTTTGTPTATAPPPTASPTTSATFSCSAPPPTTSAQYAAWLAWALEHCSFTSTTITSVATTTAAPTTKAPTTTAPTFACNVSYPATSPYYSQWLAFYNKTCLTASPSTTTAPTDPRSTILAWINSAPVLAKTPIFTVGTTLSTAGAFSVANFSSGLSTRLRTAYELSAFAAAYSNQVVEVTVCAVDRLSQYSALPIPVDTCSSKTPCTSTNLQCPANIQLCVCPSPSSWLPHSENYTAASAQVRSSRRASSTTFVQMQFTFRLEYALTYYPASSAQVVSDLQLALNATLKELDTTSFASQYSLDTSFLVWRYAYTFIATPSPAVPAPGDSPNLAWIAVLVLIPVGAMTFGGVKFYDYIRRKRYGRSLSVRRSDYLDDNHVKIVAEGLGQGEWVDASLKKSKAVDSRQALESKEMELKNFDLQDEDMR